MLVLLHRERGERATSARENDPRHFPGRRLEAIALYHRTQEEDEHEQPPEPARDLDGAEEAGAATVRASTSGSRIAIPAANAWPSGVVPAGQSMHSTHDEFVPLDEVEALVALPGGPRKLWVIEAADHRFSDNLAELHRRLLEAIEWTAAAGR